MKLVNMTVREFIETLASNAVAPGGGSVSALAGANGCGLMSMAGELTFSKKKFKELTESKQNDFREKVEFFQANIEKFIQYIDEDTDSFNGLMTAFRLAKESEEDKLIRSQAIQEATMETIRVPLEVCRLGIKSLRNVPVIMNYGNVNTISDQGVGVMMLYSAIEGSAMNVLINLSGLKDKDAALKFRNDVEDIKREAELLKEELLKNVKL